MTTLVSRKMALGRKKNNKGFSLIELVIVITIMAILTALLAPQLLRYVEQSREAKDRNTMNEVLKASQLALVAEKVNPSGRLWYTADGTIRNISEELAKELSLILGYPYKKDGSLYIVYNMPPLISKLYRTNTSPKDSRPPVGSQVFYFTRILSGGVIVDYTVIYENDPFMP